MSVLRKRRTMLFQQRRQEQAAQQSQLSNLRNTPIYYNPNNFPTFHQYPRRPESPFQSSLYAASTTSIPLPVYCPPATAPTQIHSTYPMPQFPPSSSEPWFLDDREDFSERPVTLTRTNTTIANDVDGLPALPPPPYTSNK
ncbi:hypothetical protein BGX27_008110 [Mortierella sp. AM989]|nr:hypothetical protein BGX27_008110 [Mortierella sp. AM989]